MDGETIDCGLTENMIAFLFQGSFKKQLKFNQFVNSLKETVFTLTLEPVPPEVQQTPSGRSRYMNMKKGTIGLKMYYISPEASVH